MIAEKAADIIRGRQLEPYDPESGGAREVESRVRKPIQSVNLRAIVPQQHTNSQHLDLNLNHNHHHHEFMNNKYGSSSMAESIIRKMV